MKLHAPVCSTHPHPRHGVDDHAQPVPASQLVIPLVGLSAIGVSGQFQMLWALQHALDFRGQVGGTCNVPFR